MKKITISDLIILSSIFFVIFFNLSFFKNVLKIYGFEPIYLTSLASLLFGVIVLLLNFISFKWSVKPVLITLFIVSSFTAYFMDNYNVVIDRNMIRNFFQTDLKEINGLLSFKLALYIVILGILPSYFVYKVKLYHQDKREFFISKILIFLLFLLILAVNAFFFGSFYASFFREHKPLRFYTNPTYWIYSFGRYIESNFDNKTSELKKIGLDAKLVKEKSDKRKIVIMVVGEAARSDHFSLNGYRRKTNPLLEKEDVLNFNNTYSCGTSTAYSVPCMFSIYGRDNYSYSKSKNTENVIDILSRTKKIALLWRDNNSNSKGVAARILYENYKTKDNNPICDTECRDEGMLVGLDKFIEKNKDKDVFIVLHQMGNHGPEYYKRYPKKFEIFKPVCKTNQLEKCSRQEIVNAYDNAILYTDYFLYKTIQFLKKYKDDKTALFYMSDHGESLGEGGLYLHGLPYFMAPDSQKHIAALAWFNSAFKKEINYNKIKLDINNTYSHDNIFSSILGLMNVKSKVYDKEKDMFTKEPR